MHPSLASRLSSPQFEARPHRLSPLPLPEEDPHKECRHLPAVKQLDYILAKERERRRRYREAVKRSQNPPPIVPRRKPLPPDVPLATGLPLARRLSAPAPTAAPARGIKKPRPTGTTSDIQVGYRTLPPIDFLLKTHDESKAIVNKPLNATITRLQALFDKKRNSYPLIETIEPHLRLGIQEVADRLERVGKHLDDPAYQWRSIYFVEINNTCKDLGKVSFKNLAEHYEEIAKKVVDIVVKGDRLNWA